MKCSNCHAEAPDVSAFCPQCGQSLKPQSREAQSKPATEATGAGVGQIQNVIPGAETGDEKRLWEGGYSGKAMFGMWLLAAVFTVVLIAAMVALPQFRASNVALMSGAILVAVIWIGSLLRLAYNKLTVKYELTNKKFIHKSGILIRNTDRIELYEIQDVTSTQGILQRLFGVGSVTIISSDETHPRFTLQGISDPLKVADLIDDIRRPLREKRMLIADQ